MVSLYLGKVHIDVEKPRDKTIGYLKRVPLAMEKSQQPNGCKEDVSPSMCSSKNFWEIASEGVFRVSFSL